MHIVLQPDSPEFKAIKELKNLVVTQHAQLSRQLVDLQSSLLYGIALENYDNVILFFFNPSSL